MTSKYMPINGNVLKTKVRAFAEKLKVSDEWLKNFKTWNGLFFLNLYRGSTSVNVKTVGQQRDITLIKMFK